MSPTAKRSGNPAVRAAAETVSVDLDARRQAVREAKGEAVIIRVNGHDLRGAIELPLTFAIAGQAEDFTTMVHEMFPEGDDAELFLASHPTNEDLDLIMREGYGMDPEALASANSSDSTGTSLRPISSASTA